MTDTEEIRERISARITHGFKSLDIGNGWLRIVSDLDHDLAALDPDYTVSQVKEKFGGLRYYIGPAHEDIFDAMHARISLAERQAAVTCETCGATGESRNSSGWLVTMCDADYAAYLEKRKDRNAGL